MMAIRRVAYPEGRTDKPFERARLLSTEARISSSHLASLSQGTVRLSVSVFCLVVLTGVVLTDFPFPCQ
ncbi:unnamed protein product [Protopolystoma xenopodis]|uniref:Uncharacterized protein n=1 Tax=Protopolystoma xenopodis TaxID=117903 RepID=A0A3S5AEZ4_9PLAT|nr:unnamed protein product [Protopolystoma xenopodis]